MALFSRRPRKDDDVAASPEREAEAEPTREADPSLGDDAGGDAPQVSISVSTYGAGGPFPAAASSTPSAPREPAATVPASPPSAAPQGGGVPGIRDNEYLRQALAALPAGAESHQLMNVARQLLQGQVFLRVRGDARGLLAEGRPLPFAVAQHDGRRFLLAFSGGAALQAAVRGDGDLQTSAIGQPALDVLRQVVDGDFGGVAVDHASTPASAILPRELVERALADVDEERLLKTLLTGTRTPETVGEVAAALTTAPLWIAARRTEDGQVGLAEVRTEDGTRHLEVFSHPLELVALGRGDQPVPVTAAQLGKVLRAEEALSGLIVDPAGPWIRVERSELDALIALGA